MTKLSSSTINTIMAIFSKKRVKGVISDENMNSP